MINSLLRVTNLLEWSGQKKLHTAKELRWLKKLDIAKFNICTTLRPCLSCYDFSSAEVCFLLILLQAFRPLHEMSACQPLIFQSDERDLSNWGHDTTAERRKLQVNLDIISYVPGKLFLYWGQTKHKQISHLLISVSFLAERGLRMLPTSLPSLNLG